MNEIRRIGEDQANYSVEIIDDEAPETDVELGDQLPQVDNAIAAGVNHLLVEIPKAVRDGELWRIKQMQEDIKRGVQLARERGMHIEEAPSLDVVRAEVARQVPEGIKALVKKGKEDVLYGYAGMVRQRREQLLKLTDLKKGKGSTEEGSTALVGVNKDLEAFEQGVREGIVEAPDLYLKGLEDALLLGIIFKPELTISQTDKLEALATEMGVAFDRSAFNEKMNTILRETAPIATDKSIEAVATSVAHGGLDMIESKTRDVLKYFTLLRARGIEPPITDDEVRSRMKKEAEKGLVEGIDNQIASIADSIRFGYPDNIKGKLQRIEEYRVAAERGGIKISSAEEIQREVEVMLRTGLPDGMLSIVSSLAADLREGKFWGNKVAAAHETLDKMADIARTLGVETGNVQELHAAIDRVADDLNPVLTAAS